MEKGFIFDYSRCVGCHACIVACHNQNHTEPPMAWRTVINGNPIKVPLKGFINLSIACNHCIDAPCMSNCPAMAYSKDEITGAILHNQLRCIGCKYCTWACPYEAPKYNAAKGIVEKCNFCNDLLKKGSIPACAGACPTGALTFGEIVVESRQPKPGFPEIETSPRINLSNNSIYDGIPEMDLESTGYHDKVLSTKYHNRIKPRKEIPLMVFTLTLAFTGGWFLSFFNYSGIANPEKIAFISTLAAAGLISFFHLGKPLRAQNALRNIKSSWLSREIALYSLFAFLSVAFVITGNEILFWTTSIVALAFLVTIEMVYRLLVKDYLSPVHSANTILTAVTFATLLLTSRAFALFAVTKLTLYMLRHAYEQKINFKETIVSLVRVLTLLIPFTGILFATVQFYSIPFIILFIIGEIIDRYEFYSNLDTHNPFRSI